MFDKIIIRKNTSAPGFKFTVWDAYGVTGDAEAFIGRYHNLALAHEALASYPQTNDTPREVA